MKLSNRFTNTVAAVLLITMFITAVFSMKNDSATMDELPHIPAGYSYLSQKDFRLNPEHPPLAKDLAAIPLLGLNLNFPKDHPSWTDGINQQWWFGNEFLYHSENDADKIIFLARLPMILLLIFLGWFLFFWARQLGGNKISLAILTLFSFSPTFLAHGRLVTTDVAAALGVVLSTYFWLKFLKNPTRKNIIFAGITLGAALLLKFSTILLIPFFGIITIIYAILKTSNIKQILKYIGLSLLVGIIGIVFVVLPIYQFHTLNYPAEKQLSDTQSILESNQTPVLKNLCVWAADKPGIRPLSHYLLGLLMATQRTTGGNTVYFLGMISATSWWYYFPVVYFLKVPLAFHILTLLALFGVIYKINFIFLKLKNWLSYHFTEFSMLVFLAIYWFTSIKGNLNIGVRHVLPTFPFIYILVSLGIKNWIVSIKKLPLRKMATCFVSVLLGFYIISSITTYPYYLSYFNEIAGGTKNGYKYVVDSNYDWGQDLKRLKRWTDKNNIEKIYVDYFGGGDVGYYLNEKYVSWQGIKPASEFPQGNYLAVSVGLLQAGKGNPVQGFDQPTNYYRWLDNYEQVARVGTSIFVYYINPVREYRENLK